MTRTPTTTRPGSPRRPKYDKENQQLQQLQPPCGKKSFATTARKPTKFVASKTGPPSPFSSSLNSTTPTNGTPGTGPALPSASFGGASPYSNASVTSSPSASCYRSPPAFRLSPSLHRKTPPGSSKLLREHFAHLSVVEGGASNTAFTASTRRRRLMDSGPVRILNSTNAFSPDDKTALKVAATPVPKASGNSSVPSPNRPVSRMGMDGTHNTPSKELLLSTAASRNHSIIRPASVVQHELSSSKQTPPPHRQTPSTSSIGDSSSGTTEHSFWSLSFGSEQSPTIMTPRKKSNGAASTPLSSSKCWSPRVDCMDPVAFTLLRGGEEDHSWLVEQDKSVLVPKVSANLADVYGGNYSQALARPIPVFASSRQANVQLM